jgi:hypothetical protein
MNGNFIELLKLDVAKWEEAARAIGELIPKAPESDRSEWSEMAKRFRMNARDMRCLIEEVSKKTP